MGFFWYHIETIFIFQTLSFIMINNNFTFKHFSSDKFGFASNIWSCLSANITIHICHNVVIGIIKEPWILHQYFVLYLRRYCIRQANFVISWCNRFIFSEQFCEKVSFFANRGHLQASKVRDFKFYVRVNCTNFNHFDNVKA